MVRTWGFHGPAPSPIPGYGTKILQAGQHREKERKGGREGGAREEGRKEEEEKLVSRFGISFPGASDVQVLNQGREVSLEGRGQTQRLLV